MTNMRLDQKLESLRKKRGIPVRELARRLKEGGTDVAANTVGKWFKRGGDPRVSEAFALARFFSVPFAYFADDELDVPESVLPDEEKSILRTYRKHKSKLEVEDAIEAIVRAALGDNERAAVQRNGQAAKVISVAEDEAGENQYRRRAK